MYNYRVCVVLMCMFVPEQRILCKLDFLIDYPVYNCYNKFNFSFVLGRIITSFAWFQIQLNHDCVLSDVVDNYFGNIHPHYYWPYEEQCPCISSIVFLIGEMGQVMMFTYHSRSDTGEYHWGNKETSIATTFGVLLLKYWAAEIFLICTFWWKLHCSEIIHRRTNSNLYSGDCMHPFTSTLLILSSRQCDCWIDWWAFYPPQDNSAHEKLYLCARIIAFLYLTKLLYSTMQNIIGSLSLLVKQLEVCKMIGWWDSPKHWSHFP